MQRRVRLLLCFAEKEMSAAAVYLVGAEKALHAELSSSTIVGEEQKGEQAKGQMGTVPTN